MTEDYRKYQKLIFEGDYYRLSNPHNCHGIVAWAFVSKDKQEALVNIVLTDKEANDAQRYVKIRGLDRNGEMKVYDMEDFRAVVMCHEFDHLEGILYTDKAERVYEVTEENEG